MNDMHGVIIVSAVIDGEQNGGRHRQNRHKRDETSTHFPIGIISRCRELEEQDARSSQLGKHSSNYNDLRMRYGEFASQYPKAAALNGELAELENASTCSRHRVSMTHRISLVVSRKYIFLTEFIFMAAINHIGCHYDIT